MADEIYGYISTLNIFGEDMNCYLYVQNIKSFLEGEVMCIYYATELIENILGSNIIDSKLVYSKNSIWIWILKQKIIFISNNI